MYVMILTEIKNDEYGIPYLKSKMVEILSGTSVYGLSTYHDMRYQLLSVLLHKLEILISKKVSDSERVKELLLFCQHYAERVIYDDYLRHKSTFKIDELLIRSRISTEENVEASLQEGRSLLKKYIDAGSID